MKAHLSFLCNGQCRWCKNYYSSGVDVADMIRVTGAVSAKMAAERGIKRVPLAVLSQSEVTRRMKTI